MIKSFPLRVGRDTLCRKHPEWPDFYRRLRSRIARFPCKDDLENTKFLLLEMGFDLGTSIDSIGGCGWCDCYIIYHDKGEEYAK